NDGGKDLLVENVVAQLACLNVRHEMRDGILRLEFNSDSGESSRHLLDVPEAYSNGRPAKFHNVADFTNAYAPGHIVCLNFFGTAAVDSRALVRHKRITECAAHDARPGEFVRCDRGSWTDIRFRIESQTEEFQESTDRPNKCRVEPFHTHTAEARVTF